MRDAIGVEDPATASALDEPFRARDQTSGHGRGIQLLRTSAAASASATQEAL